MPLNSGKECMILEGFGDKICQLLDKKLNSYLADGGLYCKIQKEQETIWYNYIINKGKLHEESHAENSNEDKSVQRKVIKETTSTATLKRKKAASQNTEKNEEDVDDDGDIMKSPAASMIKSVTYWPKKLKINTRSHESWTKLSETSKSLESTKLQFDRKLNKTKKIEQKRTDCWKQLNCFYECSKVLILVILNLSLSKMLNGIV